MELLKASFTQKRKPLRNNLRPLMAGERAAELLRECEIPASARAEEMSLAQFARLFAASGEAKAGA
jgi:16S rRNA (adenine1518-N6/adenine1519-N6)-dimethyltransferase